MSAKIRDKQMCSVSRAATHTALRFILLILSIFVVGGCSRNRKPSVEQQPYIHKTASGDVYFQCGNKRIYLGKAVVHEPEEGPTTKDHLRPHEFGTELISDAPED